MSQGNFHDDDQLQERDEADHLQPGTAACQRSTGHEELHGNGQSRHRRWALDAKTKELIALAIGVATRCDGCIGFHAKALARLGATKAEVHETLGVAVYMGGGPSAMYAANAGAAFDEFMAETPSNSLPVER
ncbi:hypothetical protein SDC9_103770 [bioreactor metagenome]|uniref:Carboxymuconolactone decarboxylase-like domain-containing protein n=1 Tax=bioreactor metagenome TaxID=1076179 RepID=A0A645B1B1_9ZZZZ